MFLRHPEDRKAKRGSNAEFSIETFGNIVEKNQWYFQEKPISSEEANYKGSTTDRLTITKCLPQCEGAYKCVVTIESGETFTSESATLTVGELVSDTAIHAVYQACTMALRYHIEAIQYGIAIIKPVK